MIKSLKPVLTGMLIAGLLLVSAVGALASPSGTFTNGTTTIGIGSGTFTIDGSEYTVTDLGNGVWYGVGESDYVYGMTQAAGTYAAGTASYTSDEDMYTFVKTETALDAATIAEALSAIDAKMESTIAVVGGAFDSALYDSYPFYKRLAVSAAIGGTTEYSNGLLDILSSYDITVGTAGFATFADDGSSFGVFLSALDPTSMNSIALSMEDGGTPTETFAAAATPIPGAIWLLGSGMVGLAGVRRRMRK